MPAEPGAAAPGGGGAAVRGSGPATAAGLVLVLLLVAVLYAPALGYPLVSLDDHYGIVDNPGLRDFSWQGLRFLFFEDQRDFRYFPAAYASLALDVHLFGMDAAAFHRTNLLLHLANTALVFFLVRALSRDARVALLASLLFGIHPLQVESVAWASSRKNVLFLFFFLLSALAYVAFVGRRARQPARAAAALGASVMCFLGAVLAKTTAVTLPAVLVLIDLHLAPERPRRLLPFLRSSLPTKLLYLPPIVFVFVMTQRLARRSPYGVENDFGVLDWLVIGGHNLFFYVWKTFVPTGLGVFVPLPITADGALPWHLPVFALGGALLLALWAWSWRRSRTLFFAASWYGVTLLPMVLLQAFVDDVPILVADRYFYQSSIGVFFGLAVGAIALWDRARGPRAREDRVALALAGLALAALLAGAAAEQRRVWSHTLTLYRQTVRHHPSDAFQHRLAMEYANRGHLPEAFAALDAADAAPYRVEFANVAAYLMRIGEIYRQKGDFARAAALHEQAIEATPNALEPFDARTPLAWLYTAHLWEQAGDAARAAQAAARARTAKLDPKSGFERVWFGVAPEAALQFLERRISLVPDDAVSRFYLGQLQLLMRQAERTAASPPPAPPGDARR